MPGTDDVRLADVEFGGKMRGQRVVLGQFSRDLPGMIAALA